MAVMAPRLRRSFDEALEAIPPASGAVVMGTGIVSVALYLDGQETLSRVFLVLAALVWAALVVLLPARVLRDRRRFDADRRTPTAFTAVAGSAVLGTRLTLLGWGWAGALLLAVALVVWLGLVGPVLASWHRPTTGVSFILTVGTESLGLLSAALALHDHQRWLLAAAMVPFALGLLFYVFVLASFDFGQLASGVGDHWVTGGALSIATVTAGRIAVATRTMGVFGGAFATFRTVSVILWVLAALWLPALVGAELVWPRIRYAARRWSTVFPVGMYAASSFVIGDVDGAGALTGFARVWVWVAVAVWVVVAGGLVRSAARFLRVT